MLKKKTTVGVPRKLPQQPSPRREEPSTVRQHTEGSTLITLRSNQQSIIHDNIETKAETLTTEFFGQSPGLKKQKTFSPERKLAIFKRVVNKIMAINILEKDSRRKLFSGKDQSINAGFHWYIEPDSAKYTVLRYSRAICIFANFLILPIL